ncbi:MAG: UDP-N-acetylglucosamine--N-acetylmuramyl-(pentapeptide) pyrophosphoryl-undecaprenol N-acetylglucosamine transferase [Euryarchaeota archaeon]|nr:UDP-N-acetylglucosamine--N-acetylmuramyl-(pentapeptide) pyrophosphoryl-undecaprenol N-acetylglucosamine transferase [Euryarchaeota archaeon]
MRIYIGACGIGLGHAGQMLCVAQEMKGDEILFSSYNRAVAYLRKEGHEVFESPAIGWRETDGAPDATLTLIGVVPSMFQSLRQIKAEVGAIRKFRPDIVLSDGRYSTIVAARRCRVPFALVTHQISFRFPEMPFRGLWERSTTRLNCIYLSDKRILIPDMPPPDSICSASMRLKGELDIEYVGFVVRPLPEALPFPQEAKRRLGFGDGPLVYAAISGSTTKLVESLAGGLKKTGLDSLIVLGKPDGKDMREDGKVKVVPWLEERALALRAADVIITRGGHRTLSEIAMHGKPALVVPQPSQPEQDINAEGFEALGSCIVLREETLDASKVASSVGKLIDDSAYRNKAKALAGRAAKLDGAKNIAQIARKLDRA